MKRSIKTKALFGTKENILNPVFSCVFELIPAKFLYHSCEIPVFQRSLKQTHTTYTQPCYSPAPRYGGQLKGRDPLHLPNSIAPSFG
jgi:hypothetical protein